MGLINRIKRGSFQPFLAAIVVFFVLLIIFMKARIAPFGNNSFTVADSKVQYLDFFMYFKDVLNGKNNIDFSFGNLLGSTNIAVFSYYLASPLNLLIVFFKKSQLLSFFDLLVMLKLSISAATCTYFLQQRFKNSLKKTVLILLGVSYALMQYNIAQSFNIMWLDGVYMLPLIILGTYQLVNEKKGMLLSCSVGASLLFNWYSGVINCIFSVIWYFFESSLLRTRDADHYFNYKQFFFNTISYGLYMILGIFISAVLFLPTIAVLRQGRGHFDFSLMTNTFRGNILSVVENYSIGSVSSSTGVSLFAGSLVLLGCLSFFSLHYYNIGQKLTVGFMAIILVLIFYWQPFFIVFSLFKNATSYWYRYSYITIFFMVFVAGAFYRHYFDQTEVDFSVFKSASYFALLLLIVNYIHGANLEWRVYCTLIIVLLTSLLLFTIKNGGKNKILSQGTLIVLIILELSLNLHFLMKTYINPEGVAFKRYVKEEQKQIDSLSKYDTSSYRIVQTATRYMLSSNLTANFNEGMAYSYPSISGYTSTAPKDQMDFLNSLGYRNEQNYVLIRNSSLTPSDSLLGVKYVLSSYPINGLRKVKQLSTFNGKSVYKNPFALPFAFTYVGDKNIQFSKNAFDNVNSFYSQLIGEQTKVFQKVQFTKILAKNGSITYILNMPQKRVALYGNIPWRQPIGAKIDLNGVAQIDYAQWLSPSLFYIPFHVGSTDRVKVTVSSTNQSQFEEGQFYIVDLTLLQKLSAQIKEKSAVKNISLKNGKVTGTTFSKNKTNMYLSIPYDKGWALKVNGKKEHIQKFAGVMMSIPVSSGINKFTLKYHVPFLHVGMIFSIIGILLLFLLGRIRKKAKDEF